MRLLVTIAAMVASIWLVCSELQGQSCLDNFTKGLPNFVLDVNGSVSSGAVFLIAPALDRVRDCLSACCRSPVCNVALVEQDHRNDDIISSCFLFNCVYKQEFVCKFVRKEGFNNYVTLDVTKHYLHRWEDQEGEDDPPIARVSGDVRVQPNQEVTLSGKESWDKEGIVTYDWSLLSGDPEVVYQAVEDEPEYLQVSNLQNGEYIFQLVVIDTASQETSATVTITVLTKEQTEEYCHAPRKVGRCRGSFQRWWYNSEVNECESFVFGGCNSNKNNYVRKEDCKQTCVNSAEHGADHLGKGRRLQPVCDGHCLRTQFRCADGCCIDATLECDDTPDCKDNSDEASCENYDKEFRKLQNLDVLNNKARCVELPNTGPCRASFSRFYYDPVAMKCMGFTYGGCAGNGNNFLQEVDCAEFCSGVTERDVGENRENPSAQEGGSGSAEVAVAVFLGICILVVVAVIGYCYLKKKKGSRKRQTNANATVVSATEDTEHLVYNRTTKPV